ncbi:hypothetical protein [Streptomyces sioyaensis]|uniref:hypothetical protein n=1 Tax=Streptomyces TaxID=1883 RepID=UPI0036E6C856
MTSFAADPLELGTEPVMLPCTELIEADVLVDMPQVMSVARLRHVNGTLYEVAFCLSNTEPEDLNSIEGLVPQSTFRLGSRSTYTLGCSHEDEITCSFWDFE